MTSDDVCPSSSDVLLGMKSDLAEPSSPLPSDVIMDGPLGFNQKPRGQFFPFFDYLAVPLEDKRGHLTYHLPLCPRGNSDNDHPT